MVIVARGEPLDVTVFLKNDSTVVRTEQLRIYQTTTVRKLFTEVRKKFGAKTAIQLFHVTEVETEITKNDDAINRYKVKITNGARLHVKIHPSNPEVFTIYVTLPNGINKTLLLEEKETTAKLYENVRQQLNDGQKIFKLKFGDVIISENTTDTIYSSIFDGIQLKVCINPNKWSLNILLPGRNAMINVPEDATVSDLFREVESKLPNNANIRLSIGDKELSKEQNGQELLNQYGEHTSQVVVLMRQRGGNNLIPHVQLLHNTEMLASCNGWCYCLKKCSGCNEAILCQDS